MDFAGINGAAPAKNALTWLAGAQKPTRQRARADAG